MNQNSSSCSCTVLCIEKFFLCVLLVVNNLHITAIINRCKINQSCTQKNSFHWIFLNFRLEVLCTFVQHGPECSLWWTLMGGFKFSQNSLNLNAETLEILLLWQLRKTVTGLEILHKRPQKMLLCQPLWYLLTPFLQLHQIPQLWRQLIHSLLVLQHPW